MKKMETYETYPIWEEGVCYPKQEEMRYPKGIRHILAHDGRKDILPFLHDLAITAVGGRLYIAWYNSTNAEICGSSLIRGRWSDDWGETWSEPFTTVGEIGDAEEHFVPVNLFGVNGKNFVKTMLRIGKEKGAATVVDDQIGSPTYTYDLARLLVDMIQTEKYGRYHATNEGLCSWYEFACEIFRAAGMNEVKVTPVPTSGYPASRAKRPMNSRMSKEKLTENGFERLPEWKDALARYLKEITW